MSEAERLPVITVKQKADGRIRVINLSDFNEELHTAAAPVEQDGFDREAAKAALDAAGVKYAGNVSNKKLQELLDDLKPSEGDVSEIDLPEGDVSEIDLPEGDVSEIDLPEGDVSEIDLPEGDVSEIDLPEGE